MFHFRIILVGLGHASCMNSRTYIFYLVWGMRRTFTAVLASLRLFDTLTTHNMQHTRHSPYEYRLQASWHTSSVLHCANLATEEQYRRQCCSPSYHTTRCAALYIRHCSYDTHNARILGDVTAELAYQVRNNLRLHYSSMEEKIEDRDRDRDLGDLE